MPIKELFNRINEELKRLEYSPITELTFLEEIVVLQMQGKIIVTNKEVYAI